MASFLVKKNFVMRLNIVQDLFEYKISKNAGHSIKRKYSNCCDRLVFEGEGRTVV